MSAVNWPTCWWCGDEKQWPGKLCRGCEHKPRARSYARTAKEPRKGWPKDMQAHEPGPVAARALNNLGAKLRPTVQARAIYGPETSGGRPEATSLANAASATAPALSPGATGDAATATGPPTGGPCAGGAMVDRPGAEGARSAAELDGWLRIADRALVLLAMIARGTLMAGRALERLAEASDRPAVVLRAQGATVTEERAPARPEAQETKPEGGGPEAPSLFDGRRSEGMPDRPRASGRRQPRRLRVAQADLQQMVLGAMKALKGSAAVRGTVVDMVLTMNRSVLRNEPRDLVEVGVAWQLRVLVEKGRVKHDGGAKFRRYWLI